MKQASAINLIWAQATSVDGKSGAIGYHGQIPWHLREDLRKFSELTLLHPVIMGRKTWESLGQKYQPLPHRHNIVVTSQSDYHANDADIAPSLSEALAIAEKSVPGRDDIDVSEIWIIGGSSLYQEALKSADSIFVTQVDATVQADTFAPNIDNLVQQGLWHLARASEWRIPEDKNSDIKRYRFERFDKISEIK